MSAARRVGMDADKTKRGHHFNGLSVDGLPETISKPTDGPFLPFPNFPLIPRHS